MHSGGALRTKFHDVTGGQFADLTSKEKTKLQNLFIQALRNEPDFARKTLTAQVIGNVARATVEFMTTRNARLGSRAANVFARANQGVGQYGVKGYDSVRNLVAQVRNVSTDRADRLDHALEVIDKSLDLLDEGAFTTAQLNNYIGRIDQVSQEVGSGAPRSRRLRAIRRFRWRSVSSPATSSRTSPTLCSGWPSASNTPSHSATTGRSPGRR